MRSGLLEIWHPLNVQSEAAESGKVRKGSAVSQYHQVRRTRRSAESVEHFA